MRMRFIKYGRKASLSNGEYHFAEASVEIREGEDPGTAFDWAKGFIEQKLDLHKKEPMTATMGEMLKSKEAKS